MSGAICDSFAPLLNARKGTKTVVDPFDVQPEMFRLDFSSLFVFVGEGFLDDRLLSDTIEILKLNDDIVVDSREEYVSLYASGIVDLEYLSRRAPFIYLELRRQEISRADLLGMNY
ncbi:MULTISPECIES: hypothetical protein [unclassified Mesorhizobium]|uniref:hypothetical protein n=1 Tax=unclassified Mesorhizobium TaxID=325217 RepID=UPI001CCCE55F|nr:MULTISPECIES: hypothetical protein [unclassified Mesorhizobium]MBZ9684530.1 hypothetical protein [Mesorhizobium sp. CO1-1-2]MBZ9928193.1 hypothetical protein [Mesorhizobium sp. BR1-1-4]